MFCFPPVEEVRLGRSPLVEVICQVRFPRLLRLLEDPPAEFQERVRVKFPELDVEHVVKVNQSGEDLSPPTAKTMPSVYRFRSQSGQDTISLSSIFYAVSTRHYTHWDDFLRNIGLANQAATDVYGISYATRVGLRYINQLTPVNTETDETTELWRILRRELTVLLRKGCWDEPLEMLNQLLLSGEGAKRLTLRTGFKREDDVPMFLLDLDCFIEEETAFEQVLPLCEEFHQVIYRAFRWSIREGQLSVFDPLPSIDGG